MIYDTLLDDSSFEAACYYANNIKSLIGLNFKGTPKIINCVLFEANIKNNYKGSSIDNMVYKFNDLGNIIEYGDKYQSSFYAYDKEGNILELKRYNSNGILKNNTKFISKDGLIETGIDNDQQGNQIARYCFVFDKNHNLVQSYVYDGSSTKLYAKYEYTYDSNKNCIERKVSFDQDAENNFTRTFRYDELGNIISAITSSEGLPPGLETSTDFKYSDYDTVGNWQTRLSFDYDDNIIERKLIY
jgi:hypothetical protein